MSVAKERAKTADDWIAEVQPSLAYCLNCQPRDSGEYIWVVGERRDMMDFLSEEGVPEPLWHAVARGLHCLNCGTEQDLGMDVGRKSHAEEAADEMWRRWHAEYAPRLDALVTWLEKYPYLGADHPLGREFLEQIKAFPSATHLAKRWWRARRVEGPRRLAASEMGPPPDPPRSEGRYSHHGQKVLYVASEKGHAAAEVLADGEHLVWVQAFDVHTEASVLDLTGPFAHEDKASVPILLAGLSWSDAHVTPSDPNSEWKPQYFLPRFIADCARRHGFCGILFRSPKHYGENLVLFEWEESDLVPVGEPSLIEWEPPSDDDLPY